MLHVYPKLLIELVLTGGYLRLVHDANILNVDSIIALLTVTCFICI